MSAASRYGDAHSLRVTALDHRTDRPRLAALLDAVAPLVEAGLPGFDHVDIEGAIHELGELAEMEYAPW